MISKRDALTGIHGPPWNASPKNLETAGGYPTRMGRLSCCFPRRLQYLRKYILNRLRQDLQSLKAWSIRRWDVILLHQFDLISSDRRARQGFRDISNDMPQTERKRDEEWPGARAGSNRSQQFLISINARPGQLACSGRT